MRPAPARRDDRYVAETVNSPSARNGCRADIQIMMIHATFG